MYYKEKDYGVKYPDITVDNFRDLGGIVLENGRVIKDGMIFRSGELFGLSDGDKAELDKLGIDYIFDLRGYDEVEYKPDYVPSGAVYRNVPAAQTRKSMVVKPDKVVKMIPTWLPSGVSKCVFRLRFKQLYRKFPFHNRAYAEMFRVMDEGGTFLFHCTAGKDRTGVASLLILLAWGADLETVKSDYMLSNFYRVESNKRFVKQYESYKHFNKYRKILGVAGNVEAKYFDSAYKKIIRKYKTVKRFFSEEYNVDEQRVAKWLQTYTKQS